jgi:hypothetical protein
VPWGTGGLLAAGAAVGDWCGAAGLPLGRHAVASSRKSAVAKARLTAMLDASVVRIIAVSP